MAGIYKRLISLKKQGEKNKDFAKRIGLSEQALYNYKGGREPDVAALYKVAYHTGVTLEWLVKGTGDKYEGEDRVRRLGAKASKGMTDEMRAEIVRGYLAELMSVPKDDRDRMEELIDSMIHDPKLRARVLDHFEFLRFHLKKPGK